VATGCVGLATAKPVPVGTVVMTLEQDWPVVELNPVAEVQPSGYVVVVVAQD